MLNEDPYGKGWTLIEKPDSLKYDLANLMALTQQLNGTKTQQIGCVAC
jgi:glycine cleavage system H lipoate-binding protein